MLLTAVRRRAAARGAQILYTTHYLPEACRRARHATVRRLARCHESIVGVARGASRDTCRRVPGENTARFDDRRPSPDAHRQGLRSSEMRTSAGTASSDPGALLLR